MKEYKKVIPHLWPPLIKGTVRGKPHKKLIFWIKFYEVVAFLNHTHI